MSCRAVMDRRLRLVEVPITYRERVGRSKLGVIQDGLRFLDVIFEISLSYRPLKFFGVAGGALLLAAFLYGLGPVGYYLRHREIAEDMIYRLLTILVLIVTGLSLVSAGVLSQKMVALIHDESPGRADRVLDRILLRRFMLYGLISSLLGIGLNARTILQYLTTGTIQQHWVYLVAGGLLVLTGVALWSFGMIARILKTLEEKKGSTSAERSGSA